MKKHFRFTRVAVMCVLAAIAAAATVRLNALGTGKSFLFLDPDYQQELYAAADIGLDGDGLPLIFGGVAFAPNGDPWTADCVFFDARLHRFSAATLGPTQHGTSTLHERVAVGTPPDSNGVQTPGGCGLTNHPDGFIYSNSSRGVYRLNAETAAVENWPAPILPAAPAGPAGNALGITTDPLSHHIVYAGADCHPTLQMPTPTTCTIYDLDPVSAAVSIFAQVPHTKMPFVDGIYFEPAGQYLFVANRTQIEGQNYLSVMRRATAPVTRPSEDQIVQSLLMASEPDGVAFHAASPKFVVTNDESGGTMTRFDFPGDDYTQPPNQFVDIPGPTPADPVTRVYGETFASGGLRGDLLQVGPDGCIYATQSWGDETIETIGTGNDEHTFFWGTRYDDGTKTEETSIVRICAATGGGFAVPPGVVSSAGSKAHLTLIKHVKNDPGDGGSAVATDFMVTAIGPTILTGAGTVSGDVDPGTYTLSETTVAGYVASAWTCGAGVNVTDNTIVLAAGQTATCDITNDDQRPRLTLNKTVKNDWNGAAGPADFMLTAIGPTTITGAGSVSEEVTPGTYELLESSLPGYQADAPGWSCVGAVVGSDNKIAVAFGSSVTCSIGNHDIPAHLTLVKNLVNNSGGQALASAFMLDAAGPTPISGAGSASGDVKAGVYTLTESGPAGYAASDWSCEGGTQSQNRVTLGLGESAVCTITNDDRPAHLTLIKQIINNSGGGKATTDFMLSAGGPTPISGAGGVSQDVFPGTYTLSESGPAGYTPSLWSCAGGVQSGSTVTLALGQSATCTITNDDLPPGLAIVKTVSTPTAAPFQSVTYSYKVSNTGSTTLTTITVTDDNGTPGYPADDFIVGVIPSLAPGASVTLEAQVIPVVSTVSTVNGSTVPAGAIIVVVPQANGDIKATYIQDFGINDNTYGTGAIGWSNGHTFGNLTGSDKLEFRFFDKTGAVAIDFYVDYISSSTQFPSGYGSLCASGGDGFMVAGNITNIVSCTTSLTETLNRPLNVPKASALIVNSPTSLVGGNVVVDTTKAPGGFDYINRYSVVIKASTFGSAGFGSVAIPDQHNSPSKLGVNQISTTPTGSTVTNTARATASSGGISATSAASIDIVLPTSGGGGACTLAITAEKLDKKELQITLKNNGTSDVVLSGATLTWPAVNGKLMKLAFDGDVVYDTPDIPAPTANITSAQLKPDLKHRTIAKGTSDLVHVVFERDIDKIASHYSNGQLMFGAGCSIDIP